MNPISFYVHGEPKSAGSKRAFMVGKKGGPKRPVLVDSCNNEDWKTAVRAAAVQACGGTQANMLQGPIGLRVIFWMMRPKAHYNSKGEVKENVPGWHTKKPDATKLVRCLEDCLKGIAWHDDSLVAKQYVEKCYCESRPGAAVEIWEMRP